MAACLEPATGTVPAPCPGLSSNLRESIKQFFSSTSLEDSDAIRARFAASFERAFALLSHPDAVAADLTAFVLDKDPQNDVALLSNPFFLQHATTMSIANSEIAVGGAHDGLFDSELTIDFMLIPCHVSGALSYGCVGRRSYGTTASCTENRQVTVHCIAMGRYVRNERTGETLIVAHSYRNEDQAECVSVVHTRFESSTRRSGLCAVFNPREFDNPALGPVVAVRRASVGVHTRFCPICRASPHARCACVLPYAAPSGPTDLATVALNTRHSLGDWLGNSSNTVHCPRYDRFAAANVMTRLSTRAPVANVPFALHQGILQARLMLASPARAVIPSMYDGMLPRPADPDFALLDVKGAAAALLFRDDAAFEDDVDRPPADDGCLCEKDSLPAFLSETDGTAEAMPPVVIQLELPGASLDGGVLHDFDLSRGGDAVTDYNSMSSPVSADEFVSVSADVVDEVAAAAPAPKDPAALMMDALLAEQPELALQSIPTSHYVGGDAPTPVRRSASPHSSRRSSRRSSTSASTQQPSYPASEQSAGAPPAPASHKSPEAVDDAAERAAARVAKNRAAARVSNARRKERNLALRRDLACARDRVKILREQEQLLREENTTLRSRVRS